MVPGCDRLKTERGGEMSQHPRRSAVIAIALALGAGGNNGCVSPLARDDGGAGGSGGSGGPECSSPCEQDGECDSHHICFNDCCRYTWVDCWPGEESCVYGTHCPPGAGACEEHLQVCDLGGCECSIVVSAGYPTSAGTDSTVIFHPDAVGAIEIQVSRAGEVVPETSFDLALSDDDAFELLADGTLHAKPSVASTAPAVLTATITYSDGEPYLPALSCSANLVNLGPPASGDNVRFFLFDERDGRPVANAEVIVDLSGSGSDDGDTSNTSAAGIALTTSATAGPYTVTVFADGYDHLSLVGISARDVVLPLTGDGVGGFDGRLDFAEYERLYLWDQPELVKLGLVASSFPLRALARFDLTTILGETTGEDCNAIPDRPDCFRIEFPGFPAAYSPLPSGLVLDLSPLLATKPDFTNRGPPGRRILWTLGGEAGFTDIADLVPLIIELIEFCTCDDGLAASCPVDCPCDEDCPGVDPSLLLRSVLPLLALSASGVQADVPLPNGSAEDWAARSSLTYPDREASADYPRLDDDSATWPYGSLEPIQQVSELTVFAMPELPAGETLDTALVMTGVEMPTAGFVPLGLTFGLDCTAPEGRCLDRQSYPEEHDGVVNEARVCDYDIDPTRDRCPWVAGTTDHVTEGVVDEGFVALFHAPPHSGLQAEAGTQVTFALALRASAIFDAPESELRLSGLVRHGEPQSGAFEMAQFPPLPTFDGAADTGRYQLASGTDDIAWVTFKSDPDAAGEVTRWHVYFGAMGGELIAPVPSGVNPLARADGSGEIPLDHLRVTHVGLRLAPGVTIGLNDLAAHDGTTLIDLLDEVSGFAAASSFVCANPGGCL